jgi:aspartokinase
MRCNSSRIAAVHLQDLTPRAKDSLVSFGERMSTRIFASFLRVNGVPARQFDAPEIGVVTSDDFGNADILYDQTLSKVGERSLFDLSLMYIEVRCSCTAVTSDVFGNADA